MMEKAIAINQRLGSVTCDHRANRAGKGLPWDRQARQGKVLFVALAAAFGLCTPGTGGLRGDVNADGVVDTQDLTELVITLSRGGAPFGAAVRADVNQDGVIDGRDVQALVETLSALRGEATCKKGMWECCLYLPPWGCCGDIDICDDDDDDDGGGGGPTDIGAGDPGDIGGGGASIISCDDCDDFRAWGPNYAGPGDPVGVYVTRTSPGAFCARPISSEIISGAHLLVNGVAGDTPGTVRFRTSVELPNGTICEDTHEVQIVQYEPILFRYSTFIQCTHVAVPGYPIVLPGFYPFYGGDGRGFNPVGTPYRSAHEYELAISNLLDAGPEVFPAYDATQFVRQSAEPPFGLSRAFSAGQCSIDHNTPGPCNVLHIGGGPVATATESQTFDATQFGRSHDSLSGTHGIIVRRIGPRVAKVYLYLHARDPLAWVACSLDAFVSFTVTQHVNRVTGAQVATISYEGWYDPFPGHEIYVNYVPLPNAHGQYNAWLANSTVTDLCAWLSSPVEIFGTFPIAFD